MYSVLPPNLPHLSLCNLAEHYLLRLRDWRCSLDGGCLQGHSLSLWHSNTFAGHLPAATPRGPIPGMVSVLQQTCKSGLPCPAWGRPATPVLRDETECFGTLTFSPKALQPPTVPMFLLDLQGPLTDTSSNSHPTMNWSFLSENTTSWCRAELLNSHV